MTLIFTALLSSYTVFWTHVLGPLNPVMKKKCKSIFNIWFEIVLKTDAEKVNAVLSIRSVFLLSVCNTDFWEKISKIGL